MRTVLFVFVIAGLWATPAYTQNRDEFNGLSAWELAQGVAVQTICEIEWIDEATEKTYCFSSKEAKANFIRDARENVKKSTVAYERSLQN